MPALTQRQFLRFLLVGSINTGFSYGIYALLIYQGWNYALANLCSLLLGIIFSFQTQGAFVFRQRDVRRFPRFIVCWIAIYVINVAMIKALLILGCSAYTAGAIAIAPVALLSYLLQKHLVFAERTKPVSTVHSGTSRTTP